MADFSAFCRPQKVHLTLKLTKFPNLIYFYPIFQKKHNFIFIKYGFMNIFYYICVQIKTFKVMGDLNQIKLVLVKKKRTGKWLAEQLGKSNCTVSKWCSNSAQPDLQTLAKIAELLEVDKRDLLTGDE